MSISLEGLLLLTVLLPGFITSKLLNLLIVRKDAETSAKVVEALIFSLIIYSILAATGQIPSFQPEDYDQSFRSAGEFAIRAVPISVVIALALGFVVTNSVHTKVFAWLRVGHKSARANPWIDVFLDKRRYVICNFKDGRRLFGWPQYYSDIPEEGLIYLYDAKWIQEDESGQSYVPIENDGIFLVDRTLLESIEFTNMDRTNS